MIGREELAVRFTYHPPGPDQVLRMARIRETSGELAALIDKACPDSREKSLALTALEETSMWANAAIARRE